MLELLNDQPANRWIDLIEEGIAVLAREIGAGAVPALDVVEWLAEYTRDTRGEQRCLRLMAGYRAKGLEFDHVVLLVGGWDMVSRSKGQYAGAPRRLLYVRMTRPRKALAVIAAGEHRFLRTGGAILPRKVRVDQARAPRSREHCELPSSKAVDLSYAGWLGPHSAARGAIASARAGDALTLVQYGDLWGLRDHRDRPLGRMARSWQPPAGMAFLRGSVGAVVRWRKTDSDEHCREWIGREEWEAILPEFEFGGN